MQKLKKRQEQKTQILTHNQQFQDLENIRKNGKVPVFGYPLINYSPLASAKGITQDRIKTDPMEKIKSNWRKITKDILQSNASQFLLKEMLDSMDEIEQKEQDLFEAFAKGRKIGYSELEKQMLQHISKRIAKNNQIEKKIEQAEQVRANIEEGELSRSSIDISEIVDITFHQEKSQKRLIKRRSVRMAGKNNRNQSQNNELRLEDDHSPDISDDNYAKTAQAKKFKVKEDNKNRYKSRDRTLKSTDGPKSYPRVIQTRTPETNSKTKLLKDFIEMNDYITTGVDQQVNQSSSVQRKSMTLNRTHLNEAKKRMTSSINSIQRLDTFSPKKIKNLETIHKTKDRQSLNLISPQNLTQEIFKTYRRKQRKFSKEIKELINSPLLDEKYQSGYVHTEQPRLHKSQTVRNGRRVVNSAYQRPKIFSRNLESYIERILQKDSSLIKESPHAPESHHQLGNEKQDQRILRSFDRYSSYFPQTTNKKRKMRKHQHSDLESVYQPILLQENQSTQQNSVRASQQYHYPQQNIGMNSTTNHEHSSNFKLSTNTSAETYCNLFKQTNIKLAINFKNTDQTNQNKYQQQNNSRKSQNSKGLLNKSQVLTNINPIFIIKS
ncbi:UNKNOWN [Stylonychia lemnae]|uniref:Uncharacterized protein n=1 Tax=Stylonychia lemnae TaxID=5949 RepID=A0A078BBP6_STYLE|nr:UNKNOWN [Stylonychia lemnae]|eukprot:CDW91636.1 UNKNOWN [Stylonychia lemnae]